MESFAPQSDSSRLDAPVLGRRRFLGVAGVGGLCLFVGASPAQAIFNLFAPGRADTLRSLNLPEEWRRVLGREMEDYAIFLARLRLRHITVRQVIEPHMRRRGNVRNRIPPRSQWRNIRTSLRVADMMVPRVRAPLISIISAYRSPEYNARCPGARPGSFHTKNLALDLRYDCPSSQVARVARELRSQGRWSGGVGRYSSFTHIDTRGRNADW